MKYKNSTYFASTHFRLPSAAILALTMLVSTVSATNYTINTLSVNQVDDGKCSLAEAVQAINTLLAVNTNDCPAGTPTDNFIFLQGGSFTSPVVYKASGELRLRRSATIIGGGMDRTIIAADFPFDNQLLFFDGGLRNTNFLVKALTLRADRLDFAASGVLAEAQGFGTNVRLSQVKVKGFTYSGVYGIGASWILDSCSIDGNSAPGNGGGIQVQHSPEYGGGLTMNESSVTNNISGWGGGGIYYNGSLNSNIHNITISNNEAKNGRGGGMLLEIYQGGYFDIYGSTVVNNKASVSGGGIANPQLGSTPPHMYLCLVAKNTAPSATDTYGYVYAEESMIGDYTGNIAPKGPNLITPVTNPGIGTLTETGWPLNIHTIPLDYTSVAIDVSLSNSDRLKGIDGRGHPRMIDGNQNGTKTNDFGAYECNPLHKETESLAFTKSAEAHAVFTNAEYSGMKGSNLASTAVGSYVTYQFPVALTGTYNINVRVKTNTNRAIMQLAWADSENGVYTNVGGPLDMWSTGAFYSVLSIGNATFNASGTKFLRFKVTGKNVSSTGYQMWFDYIRLIKS